MAFKYDKEALLQPYFQSPALPDTFSFHGLVGRRIGVDVQIEEGNKTRIQTFSGWVSNVVKAGFQTHITVTKESKGVRVSRLFPLYSPDIKALRYLDGL